MVLWGYNGGVQWDNSFNGIRIGDKKKPSATETWMAGKFPAMEIQTQRSFRQALLALLDYLYEEIFLG